MRRRMVACATLPMLLALCLPPLAAAAASMPMPGDTPAAHASEVYGTRKLLREGSHKYHMSNPLRIVIVPGMGIFSADAMLWYAGLKSQISTPPVVDCILKTMPDALAARASSWLPFMEKKDGLGIDHNTIIIGHSSGATAAMRYAENHRVAGLILVSASSSDLGLPTERLSGYFDAPWDFDRIRRHAGFIVVIGGVGDPLIPIAEQKKVAEALGAEAYWIEGKGHFLMPDQPEIASIVERKLREVVKDYDGIRKLRSSRGGESGGGAGGGRPVAASTEGAQQGAEAVMSAILGPGAAGALSSAGAISSGALSTAGALSVEALSNAASLSSRAVAGAVSPSGVQSARDAISRLG